MLKNSTNVLKNSTKTTPEEARGMRTILSYVPVAFDEVVAKKEKKRNIETIFNKGSKKKKLKNNYLYL